MIMHPALPARPIVILGTGHALPATTLTSEAIDKRLGLPCGTVQKASGVRKRHVATQGQSAASLAATAAHKALEAAGLTLADIDCLVAASGTMDQGLPSNAALIHGELGLSDSGIPAFDINASCLGFIAALDTLSWPLAAGRYRHILVVAADIASCGLNWDDLEASAIFGDGAAAVILGRSPDGCSARILASSLNTHSEGMHYCEIPAGGSRHHPDRITDNFTPLTKFHMDGKKVFRLASQQLPLFMEKLLGDAGITLADIDWVVPHQASHLALHHLIKRLGFLPERVINIFAEYGNQVAASLPTTLDVAVRDGRIQRGHRLLLLGTGAGLSIGGAVLEF
jgi:3-oxoacyl-[acyl-carrier-protein] synthase-3